MELSEAPQALEGVADHDGGLPHNERFGRDDPRGCPLACPARAGLLGRLVGRFPARSWAEHGSPVGAVWWGYEDVVDQVHAGRPAVFADTGDGRVLVVFGVDDRLQVPVAAPIRLGPTDEHDRAALLDEVVHVAPGPDLIRPELLVRFGPSAARNRELLSRLLPSRPPATREERLAAVRWIPHHQTVGEVQRHLAELARGLAGDVEELQAKARRIGAGVAAALDAFESSLPPRERVLLQARMTRMRAGVLAALAGTAAAEGPEERECPID